MTSSIPPEFDPLGDSIEIGRGGVPRDRWDRALLFPRDGGERVPYTAASTLADALQDDYGLNRWDRRMIAKGVGMSRELSARAGSSTYSTELGEVDVGKNRAAGQLLDEIAERARDLAKAHQKRDWGSAFHQYTEDLDPLGEPPEEMEGDIASFWEALEKAKIEVIATEVFIANDELTAAGTFDHLCVAPWRPLPFVLDKKTGVLHPEKDMIQLTVYAGGEIYQMDPEEHRTPFEEMFGQEVDRTYGITAHTKAMSKVTNLYPHDLVKGHEAALLAIAAREHKKTFRRKKSTPMLDLDQIGIDLAKERMLELADQDAMVRPVLVSAFKAIREEFKLVWCDELTVFGGGLLRRCPKELPR